MKFEIDTRDYVPYRLEWLNKERKFAEFKPGLEAINYFDENQDDDVELIINSSDLKIDVKPSEDGTNFFDISFHGTIEVDIEEDQLKVLEALDFSVDYLLVFVDSDDNYAESDDDYEFIENQNVQIKRV